MALPRLAIATLVVAAGLALSGCQSAEVSRAVGARCNAKAECDERCQPPSDEFPGGFCTLSCLDDGDCPDGTRCADVAGGICLFPCELDDECLFLGEIWICDERPPLPGNDDEVSVCLGPGG
jgi:hypothetical protein